MIHSFYTPPLRGLEPDLPVYNDGLAALRQTNWVAESVAQ